MDGDDQRGMHNRRRVAGGCRDGGRDKQGSLRDETWHGGGGGGSENDSYDVPMLCKGSNEARAARGEDRRNKSSHAALYNGIHGFDHKHKFIENLLRVLYTPGQTFPTNHIEGDM